MKHKLLQFCLLIATVLLISCDKQNNNSQGNESQTAIEITSIVTFIIMAVALLIAYRSKRRP